MVSDFMARFGNGPGHCRQPPGMGAHLEECRLDSEAPERFQQLRSGFAGAIVKGERDRAAAAWAAPGRRRENL
jgi:hypothetical protein